MYSAIASLCHDTIAIPSWSLQATLQINAILNQADDPLTKIYYFDKLEGDSNANLSPLSGVTMSI